MKLVTARLTSAFTLALAVVLLGVPTSSMAAEAAVQARHCDPIRINAVDYDTHLSSATVGLREGQEFKGLIGNIQPQGTGPDTIVYRFNGPNSAGCKYYLYIGYATEVHRPVRVTLNDTTPVENALTDPTGGWATVKAMQVGGDWELLQGENRLTIITYEKGPMPHLMYLKWIPTAQ